MRAWWVAMVALGMVLGAAARTAAQPPAEEPDGGVGEAEEAGEGADAEDERPLTPVWAQDDGEAPEDGDAEAAEVGDEDAEEAAEAAEVGDEDAEEAAEATAASTPTPPPVVTPTEPAVDADGGSIPLRFELHGYYRARAVWLGNVPVARFGRIRPLDHAHRDAGFLFQRLRLDPAILYGSDEANPIAALYVQIDGLDNVVWGDNSRLAATPLFAGDPSLVDIEGNDVPSLMLRRAWLQFLMPIGQIRVGRMPSEWGLGILTTSGNGLGEWGDPMFGTTYDRFLFATRPLTIVNVLTRGDARSTPLILALAYDKLVEDPLGVADEPEPRSELPFQFLTNGGDDVQEFIAALVWNDPDINPNRETDELTAGLYFVDRWQKHTDSDIFILDGFWRFRHALGPRAPSFHTAGEVVTIQGTSRALPFTGGCDVETVGVCNEVEADIWGGVVRAGLIDREERWAATLEGGYSSGDGQYFDDVFSVRALHPDYHVGLLLYQVAVATQTAIGLTGIVEDAQSLWSRGGVWNSWYLWPQARYTLIPGVEVHGAFLLAWADELNPTVYANTSETIPPETSCSLFEGRCALGWEADIALRLKWGEGDVMWWDTEAGIASIGQALTANELAGAPGFTEDLLWTIQTRIAMVF